MNIFHSVAELAGNTPLLELCRYERRHGLNARILAKLECCNVAGSAKDRVAKHMIERAEAEGKLVPGSVTLSRRAATPASASPRWPRSTATA